MYSCRMPSIAALTCQECRKAVCSAAGIRTLQSFNVRITVVGRLCQVTIRSCWLIGTSSGARPAQCGDCGSRWRTPACAIRVFTAVTTISPLGR